VVSDGVLDEGGTAVRRNALRDRRREPQVFDFGPERAAFEAIWTPALQSAIGRVVYEAPPSLRHFLKQQLRQRLQVRIDAGERVSSEDVTDVHGHLMRELDGVFVAS
jgi:N-methylhydantoinase B